MNALLFAENKLERTIRNLDNIIKVSLTLFVAFLMFSISVAQISCALGTLAWLTKVQLTHSWKGVKLPMAIPILLFVLACILAVATAYDPGNSYRSLKKLLEVVIFFWAVNSIQDDEHRDFLVLLLIAAGCVAALLGFYQAWQGGITMLNRIEGTLSTYMTFAGVLMMTGMVALARVIFKRPRETWLYGAVAVIVVCLLFTLTRQAWFGFLTGLLFLGFIWKKKFVFIVLASVFLIVYASSQQMKTRFQDFFHQSDDTFVEQLKYRVQGMITGNDYNFGVRMALWKGGWQIFKDYPLTGCGFRCVDIVNVQYPDPTGFVKRYRGMHNNFLQLAVDTGILGLTAWLGIWVCFFRLLYKRASALEGEPDSQWVVWSSAAAGLAFLAGGFFETNFYDSEVVMLLYFAMALPFTSLQSSDLVNN